MTTSAVQVIDDDRVRSPSGRLRSLSLKPAASRLSFPGHLDPVALRDFVRSLNACQTPQDDQLLLQALLGYALPADRAETLASELLDRFGTLAAVLSAPRRRLGGALNGAELCLELMKAVHAAVLAQLREPVEDRPKLASRAAVEEYLRLALADELQDTVRLLLLDRRNRLIRDERHATGSQLHTPIYPREIIRRVLELSAHALIVVHHHPTGDPQLAAADIELTRALARCLGDIGVILHDHLIVGRSRSLSLRAAKLI